MYAGKAALEGKSRPLVVDLDGTLVASDLLIETAFSELGRRPHSLVEILAALKRGKAALKHRLSEPVDFDPSTLPYDPEVLALIRQAKAEGRQVYLASASHEKLVGRVADHLGEFDGWFATNETTNLAGEKKAEQLVEVFGEKGFDYVGNDAADLPVWQKAAKAFAIRAPAGVRKKLVGRDGEIEHLPHTRPTWRTWARMLRVHQYAKNALIFVPLLTSHLLTAGAIAHALTAFVAFSLCASSVYILNDLVDLQDDRRHRTKCNRPLACGAIPLMHGVIAIPLLFLSAIALAATVSLPFLGVLLGYFALTTAYSFALKRMMIVDVITLAGLYSVRVFGGAVATSVVISEWLLAFCMMIFMSLALIKRYVELAGRRDANLPDPTSRDYKNSDLDIVAALAAGAGFNAITIFTLYISSDAVDKLYTHPRILWFVVPLLMYWIARALMLASRRLMDDDPVVFAIRDKVSLAIVGLTALLIIAAI
ncbi:UbiA family prenyltransferase [Microvirga sp. KLBC 81]|uniref:UbiA family prenyltransferase n=1 Tax=Microvirga sp. KLBC 81 TaxID=1862707 RepID=UPI000D510DBA|nr:UbiA family prenyltransferase [Microvirga sp. KLBC 81]PVE25752.1 UbiA family prenyltransferase [Microvirga sp. KLBC 81]